MNEDIKMENIRLKKELLRYMNLPHHYSLDDLYVMAKFFGGKNPQDVIGRFQLLERVNKEHQDRIEELKHEVTVLYNRCKAPMKNAVVSRLEAEVSDDNRRREIAAGGIHAETMNYAKFKEKVMPYIDLNKTILDVLRQMDFQYWQCECLLDYPIERNLLHRFRMSFYACANTSWMERLYSEKHQFDRKLIGLAIAEEILRIKKEREE